MDLADRAALTALARETWAAVTGSRFGIGSPADHDGPDASVYGVLYALTGDRQLAGNICDELMTAYTTKNHAVPSLPPTRPTPVLVDGEWLERPHRRYFHGQYVFVEDQQEWYMAVGSSERFSWSKQAPSGWGSRAHYREVHARAVDEVREHAATPA